MMCSRPRLAPLAAALLLAACGEDAATGRDEETDAGPCPATSPTVTDRMDAPRTPQIDVLFVIDDSGSMAEEQFGLSQAIGQVAEQLFAPEVDARFAVTTTDLRAETARGRFRDGPATPRDDVMPEAPPLPDCTDLLAPGAEPPRFAFGPIVGAEDAAGTRPTPAEQAHRLACLATAGTVGDGFEKGLEAMRLALSCSGPNAALFSPCCIPGADGQPTYDPACTGAPAFLRPQAGLAVVFLTDERDCSDPASNPTASRRTICRFGPSDADAAGVPAGYAEPGACEGGEPRACFEVECGTLDAAKCYEARCVIDRGDNNNCVWNPNALTPVADYAAFLTGLKGGDPHRLGVYAWVGPRGMVELDDGAQVEVTFTQGRPSTECADVRPDGTPDPNVSRVDATCCPDGICTGGEAATCESDTGRAFSGTRYLQLAETFSGGPERCDAAQACGSVCGLDAASGLTAVSDSIARLLPGGLCLSTVPACETAPGVACETEADRAEPAHYARGLSVTVSCPAEACATASEPRTLAPEGFHLEASVGCPGGFLLQTTEALPLGAHLEATYPTTHDEACVPAADR